MAQRGKAPYKLTFEGTRKVLPAYTLRQAEADARYWVGYGQKQVCIHRRLPSGGYIEVKCVSRRG
jgi:hypothetical protein